MAAWPRDWQPCRKSQLRAKLTPNYQISFLLRFSSCYCLDGWRGVLLHLRVKVKARPSQAQTILHEEIAQGYTFGRSFHQFIIDMQTMFAKTEEIGRSPFPPKQINIPASAICHLTSCSWPLEFSGSESPLRRWKFFLQISPEMCSLLWRTQHEEGLASFRGS